MRLPDTAGAARRWILAGGAAALVVLLVLVLLEIRARPVSDDDAGPPVSGPVPAAVTPEPSPPSPTRDPATGVPRGLRIPDLGVDSSIDPVPLGPGGLLEPPADPGRVGWWDGGARPGSPQGTVVLVGHSVHLGDGVFDDLAELEVGDRIRVTTARGEVSYGVSEVLDLAKDDLAAVSDQLFSQSGAGRLVLVTCAHWVAGDYLGHTVVVAKP